MKKERVLCPAVKFVLNYIDEKGDGVDIVVPFRKTQIELHVALVSASIAIDESVSLERIEEGFATSEREFVDPVEALKITGWGGQMRFRGVDSLSVEEFYRY